MSLICFWVFFIFETVTVLPSSNRLLCQSNGKVLSLVNKQVMNSSTHYRYMTWNVNGLNQALKRKKNLNFLYQQSADFIFLEETHLTVAEHVKLGRQWTGQIFFSSFSSQARGVVTD